MTLVSFKYKLYILIVVSLIFNCIIIIYYHYTHTAHINLGVYTCVLYAMEYRLKNLECKNYEKVD